MEERKNYVKRTQRDYSMSLKLSKKLNLANFTIVLVSMASKPEARLSVGLEIWYLYWENQTPSNMPKSPTKDHGA